MKILVQCTYGPRGELAWMRPRYVQHTAMCNSPGLSLLLDDMYHIWKLPVLQTLHKLLGIDLCFQIDASSSNFSTLHDFTTVHVL